MISAYGQHGQGGKAIQLFEQMHKVGVTPNAVTFATLLNACSHSGKPNFSLLIQVGLADKALEFLWSMETKFGIPPGNTHVTCVVDSLGRAGRLDEAEDLIFKTKQQSDVAILRALLGNTKWSIFYFRCMSNL